MSLKIEGHGLRALFALAAALGLALGPQVDGRLKPQELNNCQIDVRPLKVEDEVMLESQVYFADWKDSGENQYGTQFVVQVPSNGLLLLGDYKGEAPAAGGSQVELQYGTYYFVRLYWDEDDSNAYIQVIESPTLDLKPATSTVHARKLTRYEGSYDELETMADPVCEFVRNDDASEKRRLRVTAPNYGLEIAFTLEDA